MEFRDTDAAGIVHFSAFFPMMEAAEHELLRSLGLEVMQPEKKAAGDGTDDVITWPRVAAGCDYQGAARFGDVLHIVVSIEHIGSKSIRYHIAIDRDGEPIASGTISTVCCRLSPGGKLQSIPIPSEIRKKLAPLVSASNN
ncbi:MAG: thioesterase family protein [Pirellulaceae bacterium]